MVTKGHMWREGTNWETEKNIHTLHRAVLSCDRLFVILWTGARQAPLSMGFSRQAYWSELPCPPLGDLPNPEIEPRSPALQVGSLPSQPPGKPKNTGVGGLSLLQESRNQTQESNLVSCIAGGFFTN